jgi:TetR/AcrR family transcriptional regulator
MNEIENLSTEEKIKEAARKIFLQKGFAGTKIRDIAEAADINIALLNYYFRSKEKLFDAIFNESLAELLTAMFGIFNDTTLSFEEKIAQAVDSDIEFLKRNPLLPNFVFNELHTNVDKLVKNFPVILEFENVHFVKQFQEGVDAGIYRNIHPDHIFACMQGMVIQPFTEKCMFNLQYSTQTEAEIELLFTEFVDDHKKIVTEMLLNYLVIR